MAEDREILKRIGKRIAEIRKEKGMTQQELASICNYEKSNMSRIEAGGTNMTILTLQKIAIALKVDLLDLVR